MGLSSYTVQKSDLTKCDSIKKKPKNSHTKGNESKWKNPDFHIFIVGNVSKRTLRNGRDGGCPILSYGVENSNVSSISHVLW